MPKTLEIERYYNKRGLKSNKKKTHSDYNTTSGILDDKELELKSFLDLYDNNITEFFDRIDTYDGFFSTQQIESLDYSKFEEHVFFDSAIDKVNYSFSKILNEYPYDGTKYEVDQFLKSLDGYTRYILDNKISKRQGYITFNGNAYIKIVDRNGHLLEDFDKEVKKGILDPGINEFSIDFWINPLSTQNITDNQIVFQKLYTDSNTSTNIGFTIFISKNTNNPNTHCDIKLKISKCDSIQNNFLLTTGTIKRSSFQHINFSVKNKLTLNRNAVREIKLYIDGKLQNTTTLGSLNVDNFDDDNFNFINSNITIANGETHNLNGESETYSGFKGMIDDFRFYIGSKRNASIIAIEKNENVFAKNSLKLYLKFNETNQEHANNNIVLDSSGNKLHGLILNKDGTSLSQASISASRATNSNFAIPLKYEQINLNPVLFSFASDSVRLDLLEKAQSYDLSNPNSFWKIMPKNLFVEGSDFDNVEETYVTKNLSNNSKKLGSGKSTSQTLIKIMTIWARFFDELKSYIDTFSDILNVDYETVSTTKKLDGVILPLALKTMGLNFREILPFPILEKLDKKNLTHEEVFSDLSIRQIQNNLWKRFLINSRDYLSSKGTHNSIKSTFNAFGLDADRFLRIREDTGKNSLNIDNQFYRKNKNIKKISFDKRSNYNLDTITYDNTTKLPENRYVFKTDLFNNALLNIQEDWSIECFYKFDTKNIQKHNNIQSLLRIDLKGSGDTNFSRPYINIVFERKSNVVQSGSLHAYINIDGTNANVKKLTIDKLSLMNGMTYYLCLNKKYDIPLKQYVYNLTIGNTSDASYSGCFSEVSYHDSSNSIANSDSNSTQIIIGNYDYTDLLANRLSNLSYNTDFNGNIFNFRIYNKALSLEEMLIKKKNIVNIATKDFDNTIQNLKLNISLEQDLSQISYDSNSKSYTLFSFIDKNHSSASQKLVAKLFTGNLGNTKPFVISKEEILLQNYDVDFIHTHNKININSFEQEKFKKEHSNLNITNLPDVPPEFLYTNDLRFSIDFSAVTMLNEEISKILLANDYFTNKLTLSANLYELEYKSLSDLREVYFERLSEDFDIKYLYQVYKYFDNILEDLLFDAVPSKVNYLGFNYVYESHMLERNKYKYKMSDSLLPAKSNDYSIYQDYNTSNINYRERQNRFNSANIRDAKSIIKKRQ